LKGNCNGLEGARKCGAVAVALEIDDGINPVAWWEIERNITPKTRIILVLVIVIILLDTLLVVISRMENVEFVVHENDG
jgi:hypothetical protein